MKYFNNYQIHFDIRKYFFITIPTILTALLPIFLITGPFLSDLSISICAILFILNSLLEPKKMKIYYFSYFFGGFLIFYIILIICSIQSSERLFSLETSVPYIRFGIFVLSTWYLLDKKTNLLSIIFNVLIISFSLLILDGYIQFFTGKDLLGRALIATRVSSFFGDELILGSYLSRLFPLLFGLSIHLGIINKTNFNLIFLLTLFVLSELLVFLSGERASLVFLNLSAFFCIFLIQRFKKIRLLTLCISFFLFILISQFNYKYQERIIGQTLTEFGFKDNKLYYFSHGHETLFKIALKMFKEDKIFGKGPRFFKKKCDAYTISPETCNNHPHNNYIQLLAETGLFGFLAILSVFLFLIYNSAKHFFTKIFLKKHIFNDYQIFLLSCFLISLWPIIPTGNFFNNWLNVIYYLPVGFFLNSLKKKINI